MKILPLIGLAIYFAILLIVVLKDKKSKTVEEYFFAGRTLPFWALSITFIASWWGAGSAISTADLAFTDGLGAFWYYGVPVLISTFLMILGAKIIRKVNYLTQGKMMEARYNKITSKILSFSILVFMTFTASSQMVGIGDFFGTYLNMNYEIAVIVGTIIVLIYSLFGGFRGVVVTDIIQFVLLLISAIVVFAIAMYHADGFHGISLAAEKLGKNNFTNFFNGASKYSMYVITFGCSWMIQANVWQRISAAKNVNDARKMASMSFFVYIPLYLIVVFTGMAGIVLFDKLPQGGVVIGIVENFMPPAIGAVVFIGISAAIMSTMDSLINTGAMTLIYDLSKEDVPEWKRLKYSKYATLMVTAVALLTSLEVRSILDISWLAADVIATGAFVPLILGFFWRRGNSIGALCSMISGLIFSFYNLLIFLKVPLFAFWENQSSTQIILGMGISLIVYVSISLITKPEYEKADKFISLWKKKQH